MAQIKIYGTKDHLNSIKAKLSDVIHACVVDALSYPVDKRAHRFFPLDQQRDQRCPAILPCSLFALYERKKRTH